MRPWLFWISQKPNVIIVLLCIEPKQKKSYFRFFTGGKQHKARKLDMIACDLDMITCDLDMIIV